MGHYVMINRDSNTKNLRDKHKKASTTFVIETF